MPNRKASIIALNAQLTAFVENTLPLLPELIGDDAEYVTSNLRRWNGRKGHRSKPDAAYFVGNYIAPWPALRRMWEGLLPAEPGRDYRLSRDSGILYAARLALESLDQLLGNDSTWFEPQLREAMRLVYTNDNAAEHVREVMRGHTKTRDLLERAYPPAQYPRSFEGQQLQQQQQQQ